MDAHALQQRSCARYKLPFSAQTQVVSFKWLIPTTIYTPNRAHLRHSHSNAIIQAF